jgi:hypothetical protein
MTIARNLPHTLLDAVIDARELKNDAALSNLLGYKPSVVSKIRNQHVPVSDEFRIRVMRRMGWSLQKVDSLCPPDGA